MLERDVSFRNIGFPLDWISVAHIKSVWVLWYFCKTNLESILKLKILQGQFYCDPYITFEHSDPDFVFFLNPFFALFCKINRLSSFFSNWCSHGALE